MSIIAKHLPADERREVTIAAVIELAAEQNPTDMTTAAVANQMSLTQGALFRHFPNKAAILQAAEALLHVANAEYGVAIAKLYPQVNFQKLS